MKLPASSSFGKNEIHRPPGFETHPDRQAANSTQHNANNGSDFRRQPRSQALSRGEQRDVEHPPADHLRAPISAATLALSDSHIAPGYHPFGPLRISKNTQLRSVSSLRRSEI
ncbi:MAG UNVERIFIED_CONTAM: hypothetical protein LVR18_42160 [Planctomycetaceae bacterium]